MQYTETQLNKLIEDVEKQFTTALAKAETTSLAKSEDGEKKPEKKPEHEEHESAEEKPEHKAHEEHEHKEHEHKEHENHEEKPEHEAGHDYDEEDLKHMHQMYSSMSKPELKAHHDCIANLAKCGGGMAGEAPMLGKSEIKDENKLNPKPHDKGNELFNDKENGGIEAAEPHDAPGAKSPASDANGAKITKSEFDRRNGGKQEDQAPGKIPGAKSPASKADGVQMHKSENTEVELLKSELDAEKSKFEDLKKQFDGVAAFLTKLVEKKTAPAAKAITDLSVIAKSEVTGEEKTLSKSEIDSILLKKASDSSCPKSDRDAINAFYLSKADINSISHLLK